MKALYLAAIVCCIFSVHTFAQNDTEGNDKTAQEKAAEFHLFQSRDVTINLKFLDPDEGSLGVDYKLDVKRTIGYINKLKNQTMNIGINSKGFLTVNDAKNNVNSIISEVKLEGYPLFFVEKKPVIKSTPGWRDYIDDTEGSTDKDPLIHQSRQLASQVASPLWVGFNLHGKHETSQDFRDYDFAFGTTLSVTSSLISTILDYPFGLLRSDANNNPRQFDIGVGYDIVAGTDNTALAALTDSTSSLNRLNLHAEWETGILTKNDRISFLFDSYYHLDDYAALEIADKKWNYFYVVQFDHVLYYDRSTHTNIRASIKYTAGNLPPNFDKGWVLGGGFNIDFK